MGSGTLISTDGLEITADHREGSAVLRLNGRLNIDSSPALRDRLMAILSEDPPETVMVDLAEVSYIDASGIATLVEGMKFARNSKTRLCLKGLQGRVLHLFEVTGLLSLFEASICGSSSPTSKVL